MLQQIIESSKYDFKSIDGFSVSQEDDRITVLYLDCDGEEQFDFTVIRSFEETLAFVEHLFIEARDNQKYRLQQAFN